MEVKYTTKKIESNFSNFSAWHQRTKELTKIWDSMRSQYEDKAGSAETEIQRMREKGAHSVLPAYQV
jgi:geranylgeranyl transferase type-2 subunit alpha